MGDNGGDEERLETGNARLEVSQPGDASEVEAGQVAEQVVGTNAESPTARVTPSSLPDIQRQNEGGGNAPNSKTPPGLNGNGAALDEPTRDFMESRFGQDFSGVRVHTGSAAAKSAQSFNALAYTTGPNIVFGEGQYQPAIPQGQKLLAHELTHVVQQGNSGASLGRVQRYEAGEHAQFGAKPGEAEANITVNGVTMTYGEMIAMGDMFTDPAEIHKATAKELNDLLVLIRRERNYYKGVPGATKVGEDEWVKATNGRYLKLASKNESHFSGKSGGNKETWEGYHRQALKLAQKGGDLNEAMLTNGFGDHFLTDAFSAGHLIDKKEVMYVAERLNKDPQKFATDVAGLIMADPKAGATLKNYKVNTNPVTAGTGVWISWENMTVAKLADVIEMIRTYDSDYYYSTFAKLVHDNLNQAIKTPGAGLEVQNNKGKTWLLSGDDTLGKSPETLKIAQEAVAQSRQNISDASGKPAVDYDAMFKQVWDFVPHPTKDGLKQIQTAVSDDANPTKASTEKDFAGVAINNVTALIETLEKKHILQKK